MLDYFKLRSLSAINSLTIAWIVESEGTKLTINESTYKTSTHTLYCKVAIKNKIFDPYFNVKYLMFDRSKSVLVNSKSCI